MPKGTHLSQSNLAIYGGISLLFNLTLEDGDDVVVMSGVRRVIEPNQDVDEQLDDLDDYLQSKSYPLINEPDRATIHALRDAAVVNPTMVAASNKWIEEQEANAADTEVLDAPA